MSAEQKPPETASKAKYKSFRYRNLVEWQGGRAGFLTAEGKPGFRVASPPEFKGEAGVWCPEDLFVASVNACVMATFAHFADRLKLPVVSFTCDADGTLDYSEGKYRMTRLTLRPRVVVQTKDAVAQAEKTLHDAHDNCIVSNSIRSVVAMEPEVSAQQ